MIDQKTLIILAFGTGVGLSVALVAWLVSRAIADVPTEDRQYKDPPPLGFRLFWWPLQWLSHFIEPWLSAKHQDSVSRQLRQAALDYSLKPSQFLAARLLCGVLVGCVLHWVAGSLHAADSPALDLASPLRLQAFSVGFLMGVVYPIIWLKDRLARRKSDILKALPFFLDIITLCVEAGLNLQGAINQAVAKGPKGPVRDEFQRVLRDIRAGKLRADSLRAMAERLNEGAVTSFCSAVIQAESLGMNLGPVLRAQADQRRSERFMRAEKLAMEAPVKMLFPLIAFIFPCTFIVLFFPIAMKFMQSGL